MDVCGKSVSIDDLPAEILVQIFSSYVESEQNIKLYTVLANVSMTWRKAALTPSLWTEVSFDAGDFRHEHPWLKDEDFLKQMSLLKSLNFSYRYGFEDRLDTKLFADEALEQLLKNCCNLENFSLECCDSKRAIEILFNLPTLCPKITGIRIEKVLDIPTDDLLCNWIEKYNKNLTRLVIRHIWVDNYNVPVLSQKIAECCPNITTFEFVTTGSFRFLDLNAIQAKCPKMRELYIENVICTATEDSQSSFRELEKFCFSNNDYYASDASDDLVRMLRSSKELKELQLVGLDLKVETMLQLPCKFLKKLTISHHGRNTRDLYEILCHWKYSLTKIEVHCNDNSLKSSFRYMKHYGRENVEALSLECSFLSPEIKQIKRILRQCVKLTFFKLTIYPIPFYDPILLNSREKINEWVNC